MHMYIFTYVYVNPVVYMLDITLGIVHPDRCDDRSFEKVCAYICYA